MYDYSGTPLYPQRSWRISGRSDLQRPEPTIKTTGSGAYSTGSLFSLKEKYTGSLAFSARGDARSLALLLGARAEAHEERARDAHELAVAQLPRLALGAAALCARGRGLRHAVVVPVGGDGTRVAVADRRRSGAAMRRPSAAVALPVVLQRGERALERVCDVVHGVGWVIVPVVDGLTAGDTRRAPLLAAGRARLAALRALPAAHGGREVLGELRLRARPIARQVGATLRWGTVRSVERRRGKRVGGANESTASRTTDEPLPRLSHFLTTTPRFQTPAVDDDEETRSV